MTDTDWTKSEVTMGPMNYFFDEDGLCRVFCLKPGSEEIQIIICTREESDMIRSGMEITRDLLFNGRR